MPCQTHRRCPPGCPDHQPRPHSGTAPCSPRDITRLQAVAATLGATSAGPLRLALARAGVATPPSESSLRAALSGACRLSEGRYAEIEAAAGRFVAAGK